LSLSNYPDGMDWGAYDDYHDPELDCGHNAQDGCECWCEGGSGDSAHQVECCTPNNCTVMFCECEKEKEPEESYCEECQAELDGELNE
tara:strand:+ start:2931 stop:3194 length:264 start_codon:yes stop_codon:yes gene_type:complete